MSDAVVYSDGSRLVDSGPVGWGCQVLAGPAGQRFEQSGILESDSVLLAELHAAYTGIRIALEQGANHIVIYTDCTALIDLLKGKARRALNIPLVAAEVAEIKAWEKEVEIHWTWAKAHHRYGSSGNGRADYLARQVLVDLLHHPAKGHDGARPA